MTTYQPDLFSAIKWDSIQKPAEITEYRLVSSILDGTFPVNSDLPAERELAKNLGVTRPTLREVLQRLSRDGWLEIHQGKPTRVCDFWKEGRLGVLDVLADHLPQLPESLIINLLNVRVAIAPSYTRAAVDLAHTDVLIALELRHQLKSMPENYTQFDWQLQHQLAILGNNPVFVMILNSFRELFYQLAPYYFSIMEAQKHSMDYYHHLADAAQGRDSEKAAHLTESVMQESLIFWKKIKLMVCHRRRK